MMTLIIDLEKFRHIEFIAKWFKQPIKNFMQRLVTYRSLCARSLCATICRRRRDASSGLSINLSTTAMVDSRARVVEGVRVMELIQNQTWSLLTLPIKLSKTYSIFTKRVLWGYQHMYLLYWNFIVYNPI